MREVIQPRRAIPGIVEKIRAEGHTSVLTGGVIDLLTGRHVQILQKRRDKYGDFLILNILNRRRGMRMKDVENNSALIVDRPLSRTSDRMLRASGIRSVDIVTCHPAWVKSPTVMLATECKPDVYVVDGPLPEDEMRLLRMLAPQTEIVIDRRHLKADLSSTGIMRLVVERYLKRAMRDPRFAQDNVVLKTFRLLLRDL